MNDQTETQTETNALVLDITSQITNSNFDEWKTDLLALIQSANIELKTPEQFALAKTQVAELKQKEKDLEAARMNAMEKATEVMGLFRAIEEISGTARETRLALDKQIKAQKETVRRNMIDEALAELRDQLAGLHVIFLHNESDAILKTAHAHMEDAVKGKRSEETESLAVANSLKIFSDKIKNRNAHIVAASELVEQFKSEYPSILQDAEQLIRTMELDEIRRTIDQRLDLYNQQKKAETAAAETVKPAAETAPAVQPDPKTEPEAQPEAQPAATPVEHTGVFFQISIVTDQPAETVKRMAGAIRKKYEPYISNIELSQLAQTK